MSTTNNQCIITICYYIFKTANKFLVTPQVIKKDIFPLTVINRGFVFQSVSEWSKVHLIGVLCPYA